MHTPHPHPADPRPAAPRTMTPHLMSADARLPVHDVAEAARRKAALEGIELMYAYYSPDLA